MKISDFMQLFGLFWMVQLIDYKGRANILIAIANFIFD
jgi:hypothetical protein